ncbi:MAG: hypothetical protein ACREC9_15940 [Methylocella sp.]
MTKIEDRSGAESPELGRILSGAARIYEENGAIGSLIKTTFVTAPPFGITVRSP